MNFVDSNFTIYRILLYNGEQDLNTNFLGTLHTLEAHIWAGHRWNEASRSLFRFNGDVAGEHFQLGKLSFLIVRNSGHLLPMDIPAAALEMIHRFINDVSFADTKLPSEQDYLEQLYRLNSQSTLHQSTSLQQALFACMVVICVCLAIIVYLCATRKIESQGPLDAASGSSSYQHHYERIPEKTVV